MRQNRACAAAFKHWSGNVWKAIRSSWHAGSARAEVRGPFLARGEAREGGAGAEAAEGGDGHGADEAAAGDLAPALPEGGSVAVLSWIL